MPTGCFCASLPGSLSIRLPPIGLFPVVELRKMTHLASCHTLSSLQIMMDHSWSLRRLFLKINQLSWVSLLCRKDSCSIPCISSLNKPKPGSFFLPLAFLISHKLFSFQWPEMNDEQVGFPWWVLISSRSRKAKVPLCITVHPPTSTLPFC